MQFTVLEEKCWDEIKEIYMEAFPKRERKPFSSLRREVKNNKAIIMTATEEDKLYGFVVLIPYKDMVMVDYLAVSGKIRSKGTGSYIMQNVCQHFSGKKIVLLIENLDDNAENSKQRIDRRRFYVKNGFETSGIFINGASGIMEIMKYGGEVSADDYLSIQKYALGRLFFALSGIKVIDCKAK